MKNLSLVLFGILASQVFIACAPYTPQTRIEKEPSLYALQNPQHKALIQRGEIAEGMDMAAVTLAWGLPSRRLEISKDSRLMERWDYSAERPVFVNSIGLSHGFHHGCSDSHIPLSTQIAYLPHRVSSVWFYQGKVKEWEKLK